MTAQAALTPTPVNAADVGEFWCRRDADGDVYVERADPLVTISVDVIGNAVLGALENARFDQTTNVITFKAANGTWRYRVDGPHPDYPDAYVASRVDDASTDDPSVLGNNTTTTPTTVGEENEDDGTQA